MLSNVKPSAVEESPRSSGAEEWGLESRRPYIQGEGDENSSGSESDQSEDNGENGQPMDEEYEEQVPDYSRAYSGGLRPHAHVMLDDETEDDDEDAEGDGEGDEEEYDVNHASADVDDEMDEDDDDIGNDGDDGGDGVEVNADEDEGATSYSSEYSE